jgi:hypothetical protein
MILLLCHSLVRSIILRSIFNWRSPYQPILIRMPPTYQAFGRPAVAGLRQLAGFVQKLLLSHTYHYPALPKAAATHEHLHSAAFGSAYHSLSSKCDFNPNQSAVNESPNPKEASNHKKQSPSNL